tara:strand:- start:878 stop:1048 length:171 start_codon:yes stop_codon:yes gene_type:complete
MTAISRSNRGQGIYRSIDLEINKVALSHQYKYAFGELSSPIMLKVLLREMGHSPFA